MYISFHEKYPLFLSNFNETCIFSTDFQKALKFQISRISVSGRQDVSCGQTDRSKESLFTILQTQVIKSELNYTWSLLFWFLIRSSSDVDHNLRLACGRFTHSGCFTGPKKQFACIMPCTDTKYSIYPKCLCNFGLWSFVMLYVEVVLLW
jgi:hypothetical protein